jgi:molybdate-binding protein/DNA-binding XRE family transcriptional regulator
LENHLRDLRTARGLTQQQLASRAGITRQAVKAIEGSQYTPNTSVALRLASALECAVESIFRLEVELPEVEAMTAGERLDPGERLAVARVGQRVVGYPLTGSRAICEALTPANGIAAEEAGRIRLLAEPDTLDQTAFLLGCDPSLSLLSDRISNRAAGRPAARLVWMLAASQSALDALPAGTAHVAGSHFPAADTDENVAGARRALSPGGGIVVTYAAWEQGFIVPAGNPAGIRHAEDLARKDVRLINRESGAGSRRLLDKMLADAGIPATAVQGYSSTVQSHTAVARAVASGIANAGIGLELAARAFGLDFVPVSEVRFDLVIPAVHVGHPAVQAMLDVLQSRSLREDLAALPGYETRNTGDTILKQRAA